MAFMCASCQKSLQGMGIMIASHHMCSSIHDDTMWLYISKILHIVQVCQHFFVIPPGPRDFLCVFFQLAECCLKLS